MAKNPKRRIEPLSSKAPRKDREPSPKKEPKYSGIDWHDFSPAWNIKLLDINGEWGWDKIDPEILWNLIHVKLSEFEGRSWHEILIKNKKKNHPIAIKDLCSHAQKRLQEIGQDDVDEVISLGLMGKERIIGIMDRNVLKILWWDPEHSVCPSSKKHT